MDNNDDLKNGMENDSRPESKPPKGEIPLWLQGLEDDDQEETKPIMSNDDINGSWVPEIPDMQAEKVEETEPEQPEFVEIIAETDPETPESPRVDQNIDEDDFQKMEEGSVIQEDDEGRASRDLTPQDEMTVASDDHDITDEFDKDVFAEDKFNQEIVSPVDEGPSSEGFIDISNLDLPDSSEQEGVELDEDALREGELPEWLQEMITEPDEVVTVEAEPVPLEEQEMSAEPEENIIETIRPEEGVIEDLPIEDLEIEDELIAVPEPEPEPDFKATDFWIVEEDTSPVLIASDVPEEPITTEEIQEEETVQSKDDEENLNLIKQHLDQGDFNQALPIITGLVEQSYQLDTLQAWMVDAAEGQDTPKSAIWEVLGDIALKQQQPQVALDAYAKAIKNLLQDHRGTDEIG